MTDLEIMIRAKMYIDKLANGIDPLTDSEVPGDSVLNNARIVRCFFYISGVLEKVIENGGEVGRRHKPTLPFEITDEQIASVQISEHPDYITHINDRIYEAVDNPEMKKPRYKAITNWLVKNNFMQEVVVNGRTVKNVTSKGSSLGISKEYKNGQYGEYYATLYNSAAQRFILAHLREILNDADGE
jgi:hypothetical protein